MASVFLQPYRYASYGWTYGGDIAPSPFFAGISGYPAPAIFQVAQGGIAFAANTGLLQARPYARAVWAGEPFGADQFAAMQTSPPINGGAETDPVVCVRMDPVTGTAYGVSATYGDTSDYEWQISQQITALWRITPGAFTKLAEITTWGWEYDSAWPRGAGDWRSGPIMIAPYIGDSEFTIGLRVWGTNPVRIQVICQHPYAYDMTQVPPVLYQYSERPDLYYPTMADPGANRDQNYIFPDFAGATVPVNTGASPGNVSPVRSFLMIDYVDASADRVTSGQPGMAWGPSTAYELTTFRAGDFYPLTASAARPSNGVTTISGTRRPGRTVVVT